MLSQPYIDTNSLKEALELLVLGYFKYVEYYISHKMHTNSEIEVNGRQLAKQFLNGT